MKLISIVQICVSLLLMTAILLQGKGVGLGAGFGGGGEFYRTRRGAEKILFILTIILVCLFFITSILNFVLS